MTRHAPDQQTAARRVGVEAAGAAFALGSASALVSAYWGTGHTGLLDTVGGALERAGRAHNVLLLTVVWLSAALKLVAATAGLLAVRQSLRPHNHRFVRAVGWAAALILTTHGGVLTAVGLLVQADVIHASADADRRALRWHAFFWDPWFLTWGLLLALALVLTRVRRRSRAVDVETQ